VYAQLIAGIMILLGWQIRIAAVLMIINFAVALIMVHRNQTIDDMTVPLAIFFCAVLFLFEGPGRISIDEKFVNRKATPGN
jgi:putative oxidoreductase